MSDMMGVAVATIADTKDPLAKGRVQIRIANQSTRVAAWAQVVSRIGPTTQLEANDSVLVAFENGDPARPYVIGMLWQGGSPPPEQAALPAMAPAAVVLPTGATLHPIIGSTADSSACATTADLQRQAAPWLASASCLLRILALLQPLINIVKALPAPPSPPSLVEFSKAATALAPCMLMNSPAQAAPLVKDLLCLTLQSLTCLQSLPASEQAQAAAGIQGVLDLGAVFFAIVGVQPIRLAVVSNPAGLADDINLIKALAGALGGCG